MHERSQQKWDQVLNIFDVADQEKYVAHLRHSPEEIVGRRGRPVALG
jgi:hypothetical protein